MIKTGKVKATQIGTGSQPKAYTIKRSDLEAQAKTQEEPTPILSLNLVQRLGGSQYLSLLCVVLKRVVSLLHLP